jgi:hypothetical protein
MRRRIAVNAPGHPETETVTFVNGRQKTNGLTTFVQVSYDFTVRDELSAVRK